MKDFLDQLSTKSHSKRGHTSGLVLASGLSAPNLEIADAVFSDRIPVFIDFVPSCHPAELCTPVRHRRALKTSTVIYFSAVFKEEVTSQPFVSSNTAELTLQFNSICRLILDSIATLKIRQPKITSEPWYH